MQTATELPDAPATDLADELRQEVEAIDLGDLPPSEAHRSLYKCMRARMWRESRLAKLKENCAAMIAKEEADLRAFDYLFQPEMESATAALLRGSRSKSIRTPFGTAGFRKLPTMLQVEDAEAVKLAVQCGSLPAEIVTEKVEQVLSKTALNAFFDATGEVPPGCTVRPETDKFYVK